MPKSQRPAKPVKLYNVELQRIHQGCTKKRVVQHTRPVVPEELFKAGWRFVGLLEPAAAAT